MERSLGRLLIGLGLLIAACGALLTFAHQVPWLGRLPGDVRIHRGGVSIFFPIVTCIGLSLLITLILNLFARR